MAKLQFKTLEEAKKYLTSKGLNEQIFKNENVRKRIATQMSKAVKKVVYNEYLPTQYVRRGDKGGLSDPNNLAFSHIDILGDKISINFVNITMGQRTQTPIYGRSRDSLDGKFITDTINDGLIENWYYEGEWSKPRPFIDETIKNIRANPQPLVNAIKAAYRQAGFTVR